MKFPMTASTLAALVLSLLALPAAAQNPPSTAPAAAPASASIAEIVKMLDANVSKDVIKTYVETTASVTAPSADDLITLKSHGATDDITVALMKRTSAASTAAPAPAQASADAQNNQQMALVNAYLANRSYPESYDYFQHYYLYPRTLASVNETLGYNAAYYGFGGNGMVPYNFAGRPYFNNSPARGFRLR